MLAFKAVVHRNPRVTTDLDGLHIESEERWYYHSLEEGQVDLVEARGTHVEVIGRHSSPFWMKAGDFPLEKLDFPADEDIVVVVTQE